MRGGRDQGRLCSVGGASSWVGVPCEALLIRCRALADLKRVLGENLAEEAGEREHCFPVLKCLQLTHLVGSARRRREAPLNLFSPHSPHPLLCFPSHSQPNSLWSPIEYLCSVNADD